MKGKFYVIAGQPCLLKVGTDLRVNVSVVNRTDEIDTVQVDYRWFVACDRCQPCAIPFASVKVIVGEKVDAVVTLFTEQGRRDRTNVCSSLGLSAFVISSADPCNQPSLRVHHANDMSSGELDFQRQNAQPSKPLLSDAY